MSGLSQFWRDMQKGSKRRCVISVDRGDETFRKTTREPGLEENKTNIVHAKKTIISKRVMSRKEVCCRYTATHFSSGHGRAGRSAGRSSRDQVMKEPAAYSRTLKSQELTLHLIVYIHQYFCWSSASYKLTNNKFRLFPVVLTLTKENPINFQWTGKRMFSKLYLVIYWCLGIIWLAVTKSSDWSVLRSHSTTAWFPL